MSLILDALRKMELERKAKRQESAALRAEVLNYRGAAPVPGRARMVAAMTLGALLVAAATGLFLYTKSAPPPDNALQSPPPVPAISAPPPAAPAVSTQPPAASLPAPLPSVSRPTPAAAVTRAATAAKPAATAPDSAPPTAGISISGIAWQEERSLRRAVINGSLVGEGAEIAGARVVEIRENVVRFKQGGVSFEVSYPSGPGK